MMEFFSKPDKIVVTILGSNPSFVFETLSEATDLIDKALSHGYAVEIDKKRVTT